MKKEDIDVLKALKVKLVEKFGDTKEVKLPNDKVVFVLPPTEDQYSLYTEQAANVFISKSGKKKITNDTLSAVQKRLVQSCIYNDSVKIDCLGTWEDVKKYPATIQLLLSKVEELAGGSIDEDFTL